MVIDQRNNGASVTVVSTSGVTYSVDRWFGYGSQASKFTIQQNAGSVTPPAGYTNYVGVTSSASTSLGASDQFLFGQYIEGFNAADLAWGTASAQTVTLSFWVRSSLTGTFGGAFTNESYNRSYPFTYTISAANTWEQKSITITGDTTGTWVKTNGVGIRVIYGLGVGSTLSGTAGAWSGSTFLSATGATSVVGTNGATFFITGVQLEKGSTATSFDYRPYGTELMMAQRYAIKYLGSGAFEKLPLAGWASSSTTFTGAFCLPVVMRTSPSLSFSTIAATTVGGSNAVSSVSVDQTSTLAPSFNFTTTGLTAGNSSVIQANNSTSAFVILSAEL
jgi:hypothetical protein